jgi:hypothetical protein
MPPFPEIRARELVKNIEVVRVPDLGEGLRQFASGIGALAGTVGRFGRTNAAPAAAESDDNATLAAADEPRARSYYVDTFEQSTASRAEEFATRFADDPAAFPQVWREHAKGALAEAPGPWRDAMAGVLDRVGRATFADLLGRKQAADDARARDAWQQGLALKLSRLSGLSYADDVGGEENLENAAALEDHLSRGVAAGIIDRETAAQYRHRAADEGAAQALARAAFADTRGADADDPAAFARHLNARLDDPETSVPADRRGVIVPLARAAHQRLAADRRLALAGLSDEADAIEARLHRGDARDAARLRDLAGAAERLGDAALTDDLRRRVDAWPALQAFARLSLSAQAEILDAADQGDAHTDMLRRLHRGKDRALSRDPWAYGPEAHGDRLGPVAGLDVTQPDALADAFKARAPQADRIAAYEGVPALPLSRDELGRLADSIEAGDASQNATLLAAVHDGLGAKHAAALFRKLAEFEGKAATTAAAGALYGDDPKLARDVLTGDALRRDNPKLIPTGDIEAAIAERLFGFDALASDARDRLIDATLALYAKDAAERGDESGALNERRLDGVLLRAADGLAAVDGETNASHAVSAGLPSPERSFGFAQAGTDGSDADLLQRMLAPLIDARPDLAGPIADILAAGPDDPTRLRKKFGGRLGDILSLIEAIRSLWKALNPDKAPASTDERKSEESEVREEQEFETSPEAKPLEPAAPATTSPAPTPRRAIAQGQNRYVKIGDKEYVRFEDGSYDFGQISDDVAQAIRANGYTGFESGPVRLEKGWHNDSTGNGKGETHIEKQRGDAIRKAEKAPGVKYESVAEFVDDVARNYREVWPGSKPDRYLLVKRNGKAKILVVEIERVDSSSHYTVISGGIFRSEYPSGGGRKALWERERRSRLEGDENTASPLRRGGQSDE